MLKDQELEDGTKVEVPSLKAWTKANDVTLLLVGTNESVKVSSGLMAKVKLSDEEVWTGYMLEERRPVKSTYSPFRILF